MRTALDVAHCALYFAEVKSLPEQLRAALEVKGWTIPQLLEASGLDCDRTSLHRKLHGKQKLSTDEAQKLASLLGCTLAWVPEESP